MTTSRTDFELECGVTAGSHSLQPVVRAPSLRVECGDSRAILTTLKTESVQCCVTSPPYWGAQRDYGHGDQIGMERQPEEYIAVLVAIFREVRRVLKDDGCLWLNIGDSYAASGKGGGGKLMLARGHKWDHRKHLKGWRSAPPGYKEKDLVGIPWLLATALRADGWTLRRDVVWDKGAATEPPRADRPAGSHEMLFLLSKRTDYSFNADELPHGSVWRVRPQGYDGHSAAFPKALITPCVRSGSRPGDTILDPFGGSGTTGEVAIENGRSAVLIELNPDYAKLCEKRCATTERSLAL